MIHRMAERIHKQELYICCPQKTHIRPRDTHRLKMRGGRKAFHTNGYQKKTFVEILILDKTDLKDYYQRQRRIVHNEERINPRSRYNSCKYICNQH